MMMPPFLGIFLVYHVVVVELSFLGLVLVRLPFGPIRPMHAIGFFFGQGREGVWFSVRDDL